MGNALDPEDVIILQDVGYEFSPNFDIGQQQFEGQNSVPNTHEYPEQIQNTECVASSSHKPNEPLEDLVGDLEGDCSNI